MQTPEEDLFYQKANLLADKIDAILGAEVSGQHCMGGLCLAMARLTWMQSHSPVEFVINMKQACRAVESAHLLEMFERQREAKNETRSA